METLIGEIQGFSRRFSETNDRIDERWSLIDCGIKQPDWQKFIEWARRCTGSECPTPNSWLGGMVLLLAGAAISQSLEMDEPLWQAVAEVLSPQLKMALFGTGGYPLAESRNSLAEVVKSLSLREQLDLPGTHRYWRTVQLQVGISGNAAAARLSNWLVGQGIPQTVIALLSESDKNGSEAFRALWKDLRQWRHHIENLDLEKRILQNPWYPASSHQLIKNGLARGLGYDFGPEGEPISTILDSIRIRNGSFEIETSSYLPPEIANASAKTLQLHIEGKKGLYKFVRISDEERIIEDGPVRLTIRDALEQPAREMRVIGIGGTIYRERLELWTEEDEILVFNGRSGRQVHDFSRFNPRVGCCYLVIARSDVELQIAGERVYWAERSARWCYYSFPNGFPQGLEAVIENALLWAPESPCETQTEFPGASCHIREIAANLLSVLVTPPAGWTVERVRFCGQEIQGFLGEVDVSPLRQYEGKKAYAKCRSGDQKATIAIAAERAGEEITGAAFERADGGWQLVSRDKTLDAGEIEGKTFSVRWSEQEASDPWLTLGDCPLVSYPRNVRRQRFIASGEPLELRFGLMNEVVNHRITFSPAVYSTGLLARVSEEELNFVFCLREPLEAIGEMRLWVWEAGNSQPRMIEESQVSPQADRQRLMVPRNAVIDPLGWAISFENDWRGARFHREPHSQYWPEVLEKWADILAREESWAECAGALRWWRFPVMMAPFRKVVQSQATRFGFETLKAWSGPNTFFGSPFSRAAAESYANPLRKFLWDFRPNSEEAMNLWSWIGDEVIEAFGRGRVSPTASFLIFAHPVLLAKLVSETIWTYQQRLESVVPMITVGSRFQRVQDPSRIKKIERDLQALFSAACDLIEKHTTIGNYPELSRAEVLRAEALSDLRSWTDSRPLDSGFFDQYIVRAAGSQYAGVTTDTSRLEIAIARSKACAAFLASHLLERNRIRA